MRKVHIREAARRSDVPYATLYYWVKNKKVASRYYQGRLLVSMEDIEKMKVNYVPGSRARRPGQKIKYEPLKEVNNEHTNDGRNASHDQRTVNTSHHHEPDNSSDGAVRDEAGYDHSEDSKTDSK